MAVATIPLPTPEYLRECLHYEPATGVLTWKKRPLHHFKNEQYQRAWNTHHAGKPAGLPGRYTKVHLRKRDLLAHRVVLAMETGEWPLWTDHINGDKHDNRLDNLRAATPQQNGWNRRPFSRALPRGIMPSKNRQRYIAFIRINGMKKNLGTFDTVTEARAAWLKHARSQRGEFLRTD